MSEGRGFSVVHEDNHILIVNKETGILVQGDATGDIPLSELVKEYLKEKYSKPGNVFAGVVHRIDRPVSGLVVLAKTSKALARLNASFHQREVKKTYWAVVKDKPEENEGKLTHWLIKDSKKNVSKAYVKEVPESKKCELIYKVIGKTDNYYLLEINPLTGRPHQIRCQLAAMGSPIKGDLKYGFPRSNENGGINLHAYYLEFYHPVTKDLLKVKAELPNDNFWKFFKPFENHD